MHEYTAQTYVDPRSPDVVFATITVWGGKAVACSYGANAPVSHKRAACRALAQAAKDHHNEPVKVTLDGETSVLDGLPLE